jgi:hypothetical protein
VGRRTRLPAILGVLAALAVPMIPASVPGSAERSRRAGTAPTSAPAAAAGDDEPTALPTECAELYDEALWATMRFTRGAGLTPSKDAP